MHGFDNRGAHVQGGRFTETGRFGRMFPHLRSLRSFNPGPVELGKVGGVMDGGNPPPSDTSQNNKRIAAGYTFLGQFIDHDMTLDATSILEQQIDPQATHNFRTPALELDNVYGMGRSAQPYLYDTGDPGRLLLGVDGEDLPRNAQGVALIGDPRNDENVIISQLHLLFLKFHNKVMNDHTDPELGTRERFEAAQRLVRWHYQWIVVNEFLVRIVGQETTDEVMDRPPFRYENDAFMPVEFSVAAYRFGHSQVRPGYRINSRGAPLFPDQPDAPIGTGDLRGGRPLPPELRIDWQHFFGTTAQPSKFIDTRISRVLLQLPHSVVAAGDPNRSLASRNLQRGIDAQLPSGQAVAAYLGVPALEDADTWRGVEGGAGPAPLWFYILREAEVLAQGMRLAGAGAQIVSRVFAAILAADKASYVVQQPDWTPTFAQNGRFTFSDLVNFTLGTNLVSEDVQGLLDAEAPARGTKAPAETGPQAVS